MNITQFAEYAGVSKSAVSRYFNQGYLSEEKKAKIEKALAETGYSPSASAQSVKTRVTKLVGVILPKLSSESTAKIVEGISGVLGEKGYELLLVNTSNDYEKEIKYLDLFRQNRVDGVIFLASVFTPVHKSVLNKMHIPVIVVGQEYKGLHCVCHDDFGAAYAVTEHLMEEGAKKIAYIGALEADYAVGYERKRGYLKALTDHGIVPDDNLYLVADFSMESGYEKARYLLKNRNLDAIFCATDTMAAGAYQYCMEQGIKVPQDIMIAGIGDSKISKVLSLTSAHLHYYNAGMEAAQLLLRSIHHTEEIPKIVRLDFEVKKRNSSQI